MKNYKAYCIDLDGTVYKGNEAIEKTVQFVYRLQSQQIEPFFVTNNASQTPDQIVEKLSGFGIRALRTHIMTSSMATAKYLAINYPNARVSMIGERGLSEALHESGLEIVPEYGDVFVMGIDRGITYDKLAQACLDIRAGAVFISTNGDIAFPAESGLLPGNGAFTALVQTSTGVEPIFIGKPHAHMLKIIQLEHNFKKMDMVMIGDNYDTDILAGLSFGIDTVHVNTGVTTAEDVRMKSIQPTYCLENLDDWI